MIEEKKEIQPSCSIKLDSLIQRIEKIERDCCSIKNVEQRTEQLMLTKEILRKLQKLEEQSEVVEKSQERLYKYLYIGIGIFSAIHFLGIDEIIKKSLMTGQ